MKASLISILLIAGAIVAWQLTFSNPTGERTSKAIAKVEPEPTRINPTPEPSKSELPAPESRELANSDYELIHGFRFRKDRDCYVEVDEVFDPVSGDLRKIFSCIPTAPRQPDPYTTYDTEVLASMAYGDARAAEVLGLRLLNSADPEIESKGFRYLLHSVALTNDTRGIALAVNHRYNSFSRNGVLDIEGIKNLVTLSHIANTVNPGTMSAATYQRLLRENGVSEDDIGGLIARGNAWLESMADVQTEITGNTYIREALNDA